MFNSLFDTSTGMPNSYLKLCTSTPNSAPLTAFSFAVNGNSILLGRKGKKIVTKKKKRKIS